MKAIARRQAWPAAARRVPRVAFAAAFLALVGLLVPGAATPRALAATAPELQVTTAARYDVQPAESRVHVTLDATITNTHRDTGSTQTYYDTAYLAVLPD